VKLVINNTDTVEHSIMAPGAGVNIVAKPGTHTYTLVVRKAGRFQWMCMMPCDPYSMSHDGYMRGYITAS
jgi:heme/copper-type cytochrome/quinol oxidase subunit 2